MPEQPDKCYEHHMLLKKELDNFKKQFDDLIANCEKMRCFFFGGIDQKDGHFSFVDKVNMMYENQQIYQKEVKEFKDSIKNSLITFIGIFGVLFISGLVGLGIQIHTIDETAKNLSNVMQRQQVIQIDLEKVKTRIEK